MLKPLPLLAAEITVTIDRNPVNLNESLQLEFSAAEEPDQDPDFSPLAKDFEIINQSRSSNVSMVNGSFSRNFNWTLSVIPKHTGTLRIPPIAFGQDRSNASTVTVNDSTQTTASSAGQELFLQVDATPVNPYVQAQVIYTLKLYRKVNISQASLSEPELDNAVIEKLGEDSNYNTQVDGQSYTVTERKYAIFPQRSGRMTIEPLTLNAQIITDQRSRFNGFFGSQSTRSKRITSQPVSLDVQPAPDEFSGGYWLPAEKLYLQQQWSGDTEKLKVGEPLTRTLTLMAAGTTVSQLPELNQINAAIISNTQGELKSYPDQPVLKEQQKSDGVVALREEKIAFIASKAGIYQIPAVEIPWWNTRTQQMETATIPAKTVIAVAAGNTQAQQAPAAAAPPRSAPIPVESNATPTPASANHWLWVSIFLASGWLLTVVFVVVKKRPQQPADQPAPHPQYNIFELKQACRRNDAQAAKNALIHWGREQFNASNLAKIAEFCDQELKQQLLQLNRLLYNPKGGDWRDGDRLLQAFKNATGHMAQRTEDEPVLQPLYKQ